MAINATALSLFSLVVLSVCSCAESQPSPSLPTQTPAEEEVRTALVDHAAALDACRDTRSAFECSPLLQPPSPCDPPRGPVVASFMGLRPEALGAYYFDGERCYQATEDHPGRCAMGATCHAWTTQDACEAARTICSAEES